MFFAHKPTFPVVQCVLKPKPVVTLVSMCVPLIAQNVTFTPALPTANCIAKSIDSNVLTRANLNATSKNQGSLYSVMASCAKKLYKFSAHVDVKRRSEVVEAAL